MPATLSPTPLCQLLGCRLPLLLAGMGGVSRHELVAAVTEAGGFGFLGMVREPLALIEREGDTWWRADRVMATSPLGHPAAISAHNAYEDGLATRAANLAETLRILHAAQAAGADLL